VRDVGESLLYRLSGDIRAPSRKLRRVNRKRGLWSIRGNGYSDAVYKKSSGNCGAGINIALVKLSA
jgi:hypothetical protein